MNQGYQNILKKFLCTEEISANLDGKNLLGYLYVRDIIVLPEKDKIALLDSTSSMIHIVKNVMLNRNDKDMIYFLNALKNVGYAAAYDWLKKELGDFETLNPSTHPPELGSSTPKLDLNDQTAVHEKLSEIFDYNSMFDPKDLCADLAIAQILTLDDTENIQKGTKTNRQENFANCLAGKDEEKLKKLEPTCRRKQHTAFANALKKQGF